MGVLLGGSSFTTEAVYIVQSLNGHNYNYATVCPMDSF